MPYSIIFQSDKISGIGHIIEEFEWAKSLVQQGTLVSRIYGVSGGSLVAFALALTKSAEIEPEKWGKAIVALDEFATFLRKGRWGQIRSLNINPTYGFLNLKPLRRWITSRLREYCGLDDINLADLPVPLYLCALDKDGCLTLFGKKDDTLQYPYQFVRIGPPKGATIVNALMASLGTVLSTEPWMVNNEWYRDCRPAVVDAGAIVADLEVSSPHPILRRRPYTHYLQWKLNCFSSSFVMHSMHECNQPLLASYYLDLLEKNRTLNNFMEKLPPEKVSVREPVLVHVDLPYIGSTEAATNMRQSVENRVGLTKQFETILNGQLDNAPFDQPANVIYGAGGFSGILAGLVTTRAIKKGFEQGGGQIQQIYGVSAGVLNGFFHAIQVAAKAYPDLYRPAANNALVDLERFIASITPEKVLKFNRNPLKFWQGWANLAPLREFLLERLAIYTGSKHPEQITFDDVALPMTVTVINNKLGFTNFFGMTSLHRHMLFANHLVEVKAALIIDALIAGWSMNTYVEPKIIDGETYQDGGGCFYDIGILVACMDATLTNLINIHLDDPEGHSYNLPPRPNLVRILLDTHNYTFPEQRRRMFMICNLLYDHYKHRSEYVSRVGQQPRENSSFPLLPPDFRQNWVLEELAIS